MSHITTIEEMCIAPKFSYECYEKMKHTIYITSKREDTTYVSSKKEDTTFVKIFILDHYSTPVILLCQSGGHKVVASSMF
jgi:hypothetical protein